MPRTEFARAAWRLLSRIELIACIALLPQAFSAGADPRGRRGQAIVETMPRR